jgi:hypothetical protein
MPLLLPRFPAIMSIERSAKLTLWLTVAELFLPFIWMKIGPNGYAYYGPNVPDIYILGSTILGKDRSDGGIAIAIIFQLFFGACFILCSWKADLQVRKGATVKGLAAVQLILLMLFPFWLYQYVIGVIGNSDGAASDLRVYPHIGLVAYLILITLVINTLYRSLTKAPLTEPLHGTGKKQLEPCGR